MIKDVGDSNEVSQIETGGGMLQLAVTAVITVAINVVIILGLITLMYLAVIYGIPLIAAAGASTIIA